MNIFDNVIYNLIKNNISSLDNITIYKEIIDILQQKGDNDQLTDTNEIFTDDEVKHIADLLQQLNISIDSLDPYIESEEALKYLMESTSLYDYINDGYSDPNYQDNPFKNKMSISINDDKNIFNNSNYILAYIKEHGIDNIDLSSADTLTPLSQEEMTKFITDINNVIQDNSIYNILNFIFNNGFNIAYDLSLKNNTDVNAFPELLLPVKILEILKNEKDNEYTLTIALKDAYAKILSYIKGEETISPEEFFKFISDNIKNIENNLLNNIDNDISIPDLFKDVKVKYENKEISIIEFLNNIISLKKITSDENDKVKDILYNVIIDKLNEISNDKLLIELINERNNANIPILLGGTTHTLTFNEVIKGMSKNELGSTLLLLDSSKLKEQFNKEIKYKNIAEGITQNILDDNNVKSQLNENINKTLLYTYLFDNTEKEWLLNKIIPFNNENKNKDINEDKKDIKLFLNTIFKQDQDLLTSLKTFIDIFKNENAKYPYLTLYYEIIYANLIHIDNLKNNGQQNTTVETFIFFRDRLINVLNEDDFDNNEIGDSPKQLLNKRFAQFSNLIKNSPENISLTDIATNIWRNSSITNNTDNGDNNEDNKILQLRNDEIINLPFNNESSINIKFTDILGDIIEGKGYNLLINDCKQLNKQIDKPTLVDAIISDIINDKNLPFNTNVKDLSYNFKSIFLNESKSLEKLLSNTIDDIKTVLYSIFDNQKPLELLMNSFISIFKNEKNKYPYLGLYYILLYGRFQNNTTEGIYFKNINMNILLEDNNVNIENNINSFNNILNTDSSSSLLDIVNKIWNKNITITNNTDFNNTDSNNDIETMTDPSINMDFNNTINNSAETTINNAKGIRIQI